MIGEVHTFTFIAYALDSNDIEGLEEGILESEFDDAIDGHVVGKGKLRGEYF